MATVRRFCSLITLTFGLAACQPEPSQVECDCEQPVVQGEVQPQADFTREFVAFDDLPDWRGTDLRPAMLALQKQCAVWGKRDPTSLLSQSASYGGTIADWLPACSVLPKYLDADEYYRFFEDYFDAYELITGQETNKLTGYYEPEVDVSPRKTERYSAPVPTRPDDLIEVRLGQFESSLDGKTVWGRVKDGKLVLYPERADIEISADHTLAWAEPADVFFLQIQGSGRLLFPDGHVIRAGFDAHNHRPFGSLANHLIKTGEIKRSEASMQGIRKWMGRVGEERAREAMNVNPRFVFFRERKLSAPDEGPIGAAGIPLIPMGSLAVDLDIHPLGVPFFLDTTLPDHRGDKKKSALLIAQDTGGAIKGVRRGDVFFGWGNEAGARAGRMNHQGRFFVLLPQKIEGRAGNEPS